MAHKMLPAGNLASMLKSQISLSATGIGSSCLPNTFYAKPELGAELLQWPQAEPVQPNKEWVGVRRLSGGLHCLPFSAVAMFGRHIV